MSEKRIKLVVISDSHGRVDRVRELSECHRDADAILFLGDGIRDIDFIDNVSTRALCAVRGNCDWFSPFTDEKDLFSEEMFLIFGNYHILMMHGHTKGVKNGLDTAIRYAYDRGADVLLFGHTHTAYEKYLPAGTEIGDIVLERPMYVFNPGSIGASRDGRASFGYIEIKGNNILFSHGTV